MSAPSSAHEETCAASAASSCGSRLHMVCTDTGAYYADIAAIVNDEQGFLSDEFLTPDGRSIAAAGIALIVDYLRCHYM